MEKLLIVDDSATTRQLIKRVLLQADIAVDEILEAGSGKEGLRRLVTDPGIQLVLTDINMPEMDGIDFVRAVRTRHHRDDLPMIVITTEGGEGMVRTAIAEGANGYVTKPFTPDAIRVALEDFVV